MSTQNTQSLSQTAEIEAGSGSVNRPGRALNLIHATGHPNPLGLSGSTRRFWPVTRPPVEVSLETPAADDLRSVPGVAEPKGISREVFEGLGFGPQVSGSGLCGEIR